MKPKLFPSGALVLMERDAGGMWGVILRDPSGRLHDKVRCDDYRDALDYRRAFCAIAKTMSL